MKTVYTKHTQSAIIIGSFGLLSSCALSMDYAIASRFLICALYSSMASTVDFIDPAGTLS